MNFQIRPATANDIPLISQFIKELAEYEKLAHEVTATDDTLRANLFGSRKTAEVLLAFENDQPVGFALFFQNFSTFLGKPGIYLEDLFVRPRFRGRGYGKALMIELARIAHERDCGRFEWAALNWNKTAIDFYTGLGAKPMSDWTVFRLTKNEITTLANHKPAQGKLPQ
jgi:GNAT superfamily N-acetyltransferase